MKNLFWNLDRAFVGIPFLKKYLPRSALIAVVTFTGLVGFQNLATSNYAFDEEDSLASELNK